MSPVNPLEAALRGARGVRHDPAAAATPAPAAAAALPLRGSALVVGAGGALGSALLASALVAGRFVRVLALVAGPLASALRGLVPLAAERLRAAGSAEAGTPAAVDIGAETAFVVFERERFSNRRDAAFVQPEPGSLVVLAAQLRRAGVRRLLVVVPHAPALLPRSLAAGFASRDEAAVAALGFEQLVFVRAAQQGARAALGSRIERFVAWWFSQLRWMVPERERALLAATLAEVVVRLATRLPLARPGTRVLAPESTWQLAQATGDAAFDAWLDLVPPAGPPASG
jgi:hypothetical protein